MYVKDHMTPNPYTITKDVVISKAVEIMRKNHFHRLPVVDEQGKLIGLVTGGLVEEKSGASSTSLSIYELNYLLSKTKVQDIMIKHVTTITQDLFVEVAAQTMLEKEISCLPVVDENNKVIGIITDKDIFQAFIELLGHRKQGTRFIFAATDTPGEFAPIAKVFGDNDANLESLAVYHTPGRGAEIVVKASGEISVEDMAQILVDSGFKLKGIVQTTKFGTVKNYDVPEKKS
jgi:acetoin utilization protein AcuB